MSNEHIATYLNDHLAGSVAAVELLELLRAAHEGTDMGRFVAELQAEVEADRQELKALMSQMHIDESATRKASAWLAGKVTEVKLWLEDEKVGEFRLFESLEALSLGIEGKRSLWIALATAAEENRELQRLDYQRLTQRAEDQRTRVEKHRLEAGRRALGTKA